MKALITGAEGAYSEKKSRFIGIVEPVLSEEDALSFIESKKREYFDARHNCSAYRILNSEGKLISRFSDDGEPSGTAGKPILEVLEGDDIVNVVCVVTRYFGGVLLGTGGLVRAYTTAAKEALIASKVGIRESGIETNVSFSYNELGKMEYMLRQSNTAILGTKYEADVMMNLIILKDEKDRIEKQIMEMTGAKARIEYKGNCAFVRNEDGKVKLLGR